MMFIISGKYQRRSLVFPKNRSFRPTKSIVKEAVFNIIGPRIKGASFLDLCSGSGSIGIEAESRGADFVACVDKDITFLKKNKYQLDANIHIIRSDIIRYLKRTPDRFDFIYLDPVWSDHEMYQSALFQIIDRHLLSPKGVLIIEHCHSLTMPIPVDSMTNYKYGNSKLTVLNF